MIKLKSIVENSDDMSKINYDLKRDLLMSVQGLISKRLFPIQYGEISSLSKYFKIIPDSTGKYKFHVIVSLKGKKFEFDAIKKRRWIGDWEYIINGETLNYDTLNKKFEETMLTPFEQIKNHIMGHDFSYEYADDYASWSGGNEHKKYIGVLYQKLNPEEKKEAWKLWNNTVAKHYKSKAAQQFSYDTFEDFDNAMGKGEI
jgi:hypothetical protein